MSHFLRWGGAAVRVVWVRGVVGLVWMAVKGGEVGQGGLYEFYVFMCILSQQQDTSLLLTGLLTGVSR